MSRKDPGRVMDSWISTPQPDRIGYVKFQKIYGNIVNYIYFRSVSRPETVCERHMKGKKGSKSPLERGPARAKSEPAQRRTLWEILDSDKPYRLMFERTGDAVFILGAEGEDSGRILSANRAAEKMYGYSQDELAGLDFSGLYASCTVMDVSAMISRMREGEWIKEEVVHRRKDGSVFPAEISAGLLESGRHRYIIAFDRDISARKRIENALVEKEQKYRSLVESTDDSIYLVDRENNYLFMNANHRKRMGFADGKYEGRPYAEYHSKEESDVFREQTDKVFETGLSCQVEYKSRRDGRYFLRSFGPVKDDNGNVTAVTITSKDITKLKEMEEELRTLSLTDELTGLYNRRGFFTLCNQQLKMANRFRRGLYLLFADLDGLKTINDTWGHQEGNAALMEAANILKHTFRDSDIICRMGGDEFVVIPVATSEEDITRVIERLQVSIDSFNKANSGGFTLSMSVGKAYYDPGNPSSPEALLEQADSAMYEEKRRKKLM